MTQNAVVTKLLPDSMAEVVVTRTTACGNNCGSCESCIFQSEMKTIARNRIHAKPGQQVVIESRTSKVFFAAAIVYIMPLILFVFGFIIAHLAGASEGVSVMVSFLFLLLSACILVVYHKRMKDDQKIQLILFPDRRRL